MNVRGILPAAYQVLHLQSYPGGGVRHLWTGGTPYLAGMLGYPHLDLAGGYTFLGWGTHRMDLAAVTLPVWTGQGSTPPPPGMNKLAKQAVASWWQDHVLSEHPTNGWCHTAPPPHIRLVPVFTPFVKWVRGLQIYCPSPLPTWVSNQGRLSTSQSSWTLTTTPPGPA